MLECWCLSCGAFSPLSVLKHCFLASQKTKSRYRQQASFARSSQFCCWVFFPSKMINQQSLCFFHGHYPDKSAGHQWLFRGLFTCLKIVFSFILYLQMCLLWEEGVFKFLKNTEQTGESLLWLKPEEALSVYQCCFHIIWMLYHPVNSQGLLP